MEHIFSTRPIKRCGIISISLQNLIIISIRRLLFTKMNFIICRLIWNTFSKMWGIKTPQEAKEKIAQQVAETGITEPKNLEEQGLSLVGKRCVWKNW